MSHMLDLEKRCPVCNEVGPAQGIDGEHQGVWLCKNNDCSKEHFVHSTVQFYDPAEVNWTWDEVKEKMT